ncbi:MAG: PSP1 domain-containing protein, partial [Planctomycetota bacterium]
MPIHPLPVFEADADPRHREAMSDEETYERLEPPDTVVVRFGCLKQIGEYPYDGEVTPGCGSKLVARTHRGTEIVEMLTTTCENAGCAKSVTRQEMLDYIEGSGGKDFPFRTNGKILHVATIEELNKQSALDSNKKQYIKTCKALIGELDLPMKLVEVEPILGEELLTFYFMAKDRVDFRKLVRRLAGEFKTRIEMRQVGARDEARLVADYERCGQHCCCKSFLKVLKPVSMKSAKLQKATLDPLKISGRCGRLMCCLRYEDQTYDELRKKLPKKGKRVGTGEGPGRVVDTKILVQLALVRLEHNEQEIAVAIEELMDPDQCPAPGEAAAA